MLEIVSFMGPAVLSALLKVWQRRDDAAQRRHERELALITKQQAVHTEAARRGVPENLFAQVWYVPVTPIITYGAFLAFIALPFLPAVLTSPVNMELCTSPTGFWPWLLGQEAAVCRYITLGPGITWMNVHTQVVLMITGFWFGERVVKNT